MSNGNNDTFEKFQLSEYENIASAHFETAKQVSNFFRYYLIIVSAPAIIILALNSNGLSLQKLFCHTVPIIYIHLTYIFFFVLSFIGFFLCMYIVNLRLDSILYARTVNGIRRYFYQEQEYELGIENRFRVLSTNINQPRYLELHLFIPVVMTFAIINSSFFGIVFHLYFKGQLNLVTILGVIIFIFVHLFTYWYLSYHRNNYYMRSHKIGIDIDGVLNDHRQHFCDILKESVGKDLKPEEITKIPVRNIVGKGITVEDEKSVFNNKNYWKDMPPIQPSFPELNYLSEILGYKIYIFTNRPWPDKSSNKWGKDNIKNLTKQWLKDNNISYNKFILEQGDTDRSDTTSWMFRWKAPRSLNRYQYSIKKNFRYFVEDSPDAAMKLSSLCDYVFLMKQPYNEHTEYPTNVIIVNSWAEILKHIKDFS